MQFDPNKGRALPGIRCGCAAVLFLAAAAACAAAPTEDLRRMQAAYDYRSMVEAYVEFMIANGRDHYGKLHSPLFVSVMDRKTGQVFRNIKAVPYPHVITRPYAPGLRRDHKMRPQDRTYSGGNPLEDLPLYGLLYRLTELTGDSRYATEADKSIDWFLEHAQSPVTALFAWGSHMYWDVHLDAPIYANTGSPGGGYGGHEYNYVWPYWQRNPAALARFGRGLWDNQIADKKTGRFSRHADFHRRSVEPGFEFPQTGSCYIDIWARAYAAGGDPEMKRAIETLLALYRSMRDPDTGAMAWCTAEGADRRGVTNVPMNLFMATTIQDAAAFVELRDPALAGDMRAFCREIDDEYLSNDLTETLDIRGKGILTWYTLKDRQPMPRDSSGPPPGFEQAGIGFPLRTADGKPAANMAYLAPWFVNRSYAELAVLFLGRLQRAEDRHKPAYRQAVLDTADLYMTIEPEVQFVVYPDDLAHVVTLLREVFRLTGNPAYLHRADRMMKLAVRLLFDDVSPLPKISSFDDWYESSLKNGSSVEIMRQMLELSEDLAALPEADRAAVEVQPATAWTAPAKSIADPAAAAAFAAAFEKGLAEGQSFTWKGEGLNREARDIVLRHGRNRDLSLFLSLAEGRFAPEGLRGAAWNIGVSDVINRIPSAAEADALNGRPAEFTGKRMEVGHIPDAGFKDAVRQVAVLLRSEGSSAADVVVSATLHDTYHDNGEVRHVHTMKPGEQRLFVLAADPEKRIRRLTIKTDSPQAKLHLQSQSFVLAPLGSRPMTVEKSPP